MSFVRRHAYCPDRGGHSQDEPDIRPDEQRRICCRRDDLRVSLKMEETRRQLCDQLDRVASASHFHFGISRCVYLNIVKPIPSKGMKLKVKGLEKCELLVYVPLDTACNRVNTPLNSRCIPGEWEYSYNEQEEERYVTRQGEMKGKKEFFKVEIRLIDYPGKLRHAL